MPAFLKLRPSTYAYLLLAFLASAPAWIVRYPPLQDMAFHVATLRVIHDFNNPTLQFSRDFILNIWHTQYVLYYLVGSLLAYLVGVVNANIALLCVYLGGTPLAMRALLRALGRDERLCLFVVPLLANTMFLFGFLPFLFGIPLMLWAVAQSVLYFEETTWQRGVAVALLAVFVFYSHVFPFAVFGLSYAVLFPWSMPRKWLAAGAAVLPALLLLMWWTRFSEAGQQSSAAFGLALQAHPLNESLPGVFPWVLDVFRDSSDEVILVALIGLAAIASGLALGEVDSAKPISRKFVFIPVLCGFGYLATGDNLGPVWLFSQRFPILALFMSVPLLRMPRGSQSARSVFSTVAATALAAYATVNTCRHFIAFQRLEVGDLDGALATMEPGKRVAALIYDKHSTFINWAPFLHFGSYYQVHKGGLVYFTYATWSHWPFRFKPGALPPGHPTRARWEWTPEAVPVMGELYPYYDYVLTRGAGFSPPPGTFRLQWRGDRWAVWRREGP